MYYRDAHGVLIFYDITRRDTFIGKVDEWVNTVKNGASEDVNIILVGNKVDDEANREVTTEEGRECAERLGVPFFEVSAKSGIFINEMFNKLGEMIAENSWDKLRRENKEIVLGNGHLTTKTKKSKCFI